MERMALYLAAPHDALACERALRLGDDRVLSYRLA